MARVLFRSDLQDDDNNGIIDISVTVPASPTTTQTFARFRWSSSSGIASDTAVSDGEVEDYLIASIGQASADLTALKSVEVHDPTNVGLYMTPGNEVIYTIAVTNSSAATAIAEYIDIADTLPDTVRFVSATATGFTGGAFGLPDLPPANTDCNAGACVIRYSGGSLPVDTMGEISIIALIK